MLLGKELTGFVKRLVISNKNIQGHVTQGASLHRMNTDVLQLPGQRQYCWAEEHKYIIRPSWPINHCLRNKLFDRRQYRWNPKSVTLREQ